MATESSNLTDESGKVSVAFKDENGELKNTYQILNDLAPQWKNLNDEQKTQLAQSVAGKGSLAFYRFNKRERRNTTEKYMFLNCNYIMVA